jgi:amino acid transporter
MNVRQDMRASDHDRQQVVDVLRTGLEDGRLTMEEYTERMGRAYQAVTYADLAPLSADLPAEGPPAPQPSAPEPRVGLPAPLRVLWAIWLSVVLVNVVVWALVCLTTASLIYPWPLWVAGPYGAVLLAVSAAVRCRGARACARSAQRASAR